LAVAARSPAAAPTFVAVDLGTLGGPTSTARAVNDSGTVFGISNTATGDYHMFSWTQTGGMVDLGSFGTGQNFSMSSTGQGVGEMSTSSGHHAYSWTQATGVVDLGTFGGSLSAAYVVSNSGFIAGSAMTAAGDSHGALWTPSGAMLDMGPMDPYAVNDAGLVVGRDQSTNRAASWTASGGLVDLGSPVGSQSVANAVSNTGQIVGYNWSPQGVPRAFSWTLDGGMVDIGPTWALTTPNAISDSGQVVGSGAPVPGPSHAFSWTQADGIVDLGTLGGTSSAAWVVNSAGQVAGTAKTSSGDTHAFAWTKADGMVDAGLVPGSLPARVMAENAAGMIVGWSSLASDVHATAWMPSAASPPSSDSGGGSGGGGGSSMVAVTLTPSSQTIASGGTANWTVSVTNTGGAYLYAVTVTDAAAPGCLPPSSDGDTLYFMPPGLTVTYGCSLGGVTANMTNNIAVTATTAPGDTLTATASASVTVTGGAPLTPPATKHVIPLVRPVIAKAVAFPAKPHAGKSVLVGFKITRSDTGTKLTSGKMICDPRIGTHLLKHAEQFKNGTASLRFTIPKTASHKTLKVHLTIRLGTQSATRIATFHIS
jgi:uncharacterized repeat protein (TIGR01451 family)